MNNGTLTGSNMKEESVDGIRPKSGGLTPFSAMIHRLIAFSGRAKSDQSNGMPKDGSFILLTGVIIAEC
jgi:hypothetical protein